MNEDISEQDQKLLLEEYRIVESKWRFFQGLRYGLTAFAITFQVTLLGAFSYVLVNQSGQKLISGFSDFALLFLPSMAILSQIATVLLDLRLRQLYAICSERCSAIERVLKFPDVLGSKSIFSALSTAPRKRFFFLSHTHGSYGMALAAFVMWLYLLYKIGVPHNALLFAEIYKNLTHLLK